MKGLAHFLTRQIAKHAAHFTDGIAAVAQPHAFQNETRLFKTKVTVAVVVVIRTEETAFFIMLQKVAPYPHVVGVVPNAIPSD